VLEKAPPQQQYSRQDVRRMLAISEQQLRGWQRQGFIPASESFSFSDLIALRALQKLRESRIPSKQIGRALVSLKQEREAIRHMATRATRDTEGVDLFMESPRAPR